MELPQNLHVVGDTKKLPFMLGDRRIHATNGTYINSENIVVPTTLAGFQIIADDTSLSDKRDAFLIAINSDKSLQAVMTKKGASQEDIHALESQIVRAVKVATPLALQHPNREIFVTFYDEETPNKLYTTLAEKGAPLFSLHKHGYGTEPNAPKIEGTENFAVTLGFPLPNNTKPVCYDQTPRETQGFVDVRDLTTTTGAHGKPYLSQEGKVLFPVHDDIYQHTQAYADAERALAAKGNPSAPAASLS